MQLDAGEEGVPFHAQPAVETPAAEPALPATEASTSVTSEEEA